MKNAESEQDDDLRPEYDFSQMKRGVRGEYVERYREDWTQLSLESLARAYSDDEPEYSLDLIKEANPADEEVK